MGIERLPLIVSKLLDHGRDPDTPVAVISNGTLPSQKVVTGTLCTISDLAVGVIPPAAIVVGEVVRVRERLAQFAAMVHAERQTANT
jgi:siroheme synthase